VVVIAAADKKYISNNIMRAETLFRKYKQQLITKFGRKAMWDADIDDYCKKEFGNKYIGTFAQDQFKLAPGYQIINTATSKQKNGEHWVSIYQTPKTCFVYDSFGRPTGKLLRILTKKLRKKKIRIVDSDPDQEQRGSSQVCGQLCIAYLHVVEKLGIRKALNI
jgi:hypothetical protein